MIGARTRHLMLLSLDDLGVLKAWVSANPQPWVAHLPRSVSFLSLLPQISHLAQRAFYRNALVLVRVRLNIRFELMIPLLFECLV